jgi:hypothetical protein
VARRGLCLAERLEEAEGALPVEREEFHAPGSRSSTIS